LLAIAVVSLAALFALLLPIPGITAYLLAITLASQWIHRSGFDSSVVSLSDVLLAGPLIRFSWPAILRLFQGRMRVPRPLHAFSWSLAVVILVAAMVSQGMDRSALHQFVLFGPLPLALLQLGPRQSRQVLVCVVAVAGAIGGIATLVSATDNAWLSSMVFVRLQTVTTDAFSDTSNARVILPGIWTIAPFGFWIALGLLMQGHLALRARLFVGAAAVLVLLGLAVNYSRSVAVPFLAGLVAMVFAGMLSKNRISAKRSGLIVTGILLLVTANLALRPGLRENWSERFFGQQRFGTVNARVNASQMLADSLQSRGEIIGRCSSYFGNFTAAGDPFAPLTAWHNFGFVGMAAYILLVLAILASALLASYHGVRRANGPSLAGVVSYGYLFYFVAGILSGFYFTEDMIVPIVIWIWILTMREPSGGPVPAEELALAPVGDSVQVSS
jgi:hypothetical protein